MGEEYAYLTPLERSLMSVLKHIVSQVKRPDGGPTIKLACIKSDAGAAVFDAVLLNLSRMSAVEYDEAREAVAKQWGMRIGKLDDLVEKRRLIVSIGLNPHQDWFHQASKEQRKFVRAELTRAPVYKKPSKAKGGE
mgnify:CR=1 FL=1